MDTHVGEVPADTHAGEVPADTHVGAGASTRWRLSSPVKPPGGVGRL